MRRFVIHRILAYDELHVGNSANYIICMKMFSVTCHSVKSFHYCSCQLLILPGYFDGNKKNKDHNQNKIKEAEVSF